MAMNGNDILKLLAVPTLILLVSVAMNIYLFIKWQHAEEYVSAKCESSDGDYPVPIANDYHLCWRVEK